MFFLRKFFSRRWLLTTLLVLAAMGVMARLGKWQLDRLGQRRAFNARVEAQINQPQLDLSGENLSADLPGMEYRKVAVTGEYDFSQQIALRNQVKDGQWGVSLITPLKIAGSDRAVLVERGWIPGEDFTSGAWSKYDEPGVVHVEGVIRASSTRPDFGRRRDTLPGPGEPPLKAWNFINVAGIDQQVSYDLLLVYIQQAPDPAWTGLPARTQPELELTEGPHMGYALQWFTFALILGAGYPFFIRRQEAQNAKELTPSPTVDEDLLAAHRSVR